MRTRFADLPPAARALRAAHFAITLAMLYAIAHVWLCAFTGRRDRRLGVALAALACESAAVGFNGGKCPLGPLQEKAGDPVPLFELLLPPRAAKAAVPVLGAVAATGAALVVARRAAPQAVLRGRTEVASC